MASTKFNPAFTAEFSEHILFLLGAEAVNFKPIYISTADPDGDFTALAEGAYFMDELGTGRKVSGARTYFSTESWVNQQITTAIEGLQKEFFFDPTVDTAPTRSDGSVKANDTYIVTADGTFDGQSLRKGDILKAKADVASNPSFSDYYWNEAVSGLENVPDATTSVKGIVMLVDAIRRDGNASTTLVATEKAVHDALAASEAALNAAITAGDAALQSQVTTLSGQTATNASDIDALEAADTAQDALIAANTAELENFVKFSHNSEQVIGSPLKIGGGLSQATTTSNNVFHVNADEVVTPQGETLSGVTFGDTVQIRKVSDDSLVDTVTVTGVGSDSFGIAGNITGFSGVDMYVYVVGDDESLTVTEDLYAKTGKMTETEDKLFMTQSEKDALADASTDIGTLQSQMTAVEAANTAQDALISTIDTRSSNNTDDIEDLQTLTASHTANIASVQVDANVAQDTADQALSDASTAQSAADAAQSTADTAVTNAATAQSKANANETAINTIEGAIDNLDIAVETLEGDVATQGANITAAQSDATQALSDASTAQTAADAAQADADTNATAITAVQAVNTTQNAAISTLNTEMDAAESRLTAIEAYTMQEVVLSIGNGTDSNISLPTGKTWKNPNALNFVTLVSDGGVYKRSRVMNTQYVDPATGEFVMRFANPPATGEYQVIVSGLAQV